MMKRLIKDAWRGAHELPYFGNHPGNVVMLMFLGIGILAGIQTHSWRGLLVSVLIMLVFLGPIYILGCVPRARESDRMVIMKQGFDSLQERNP